MSEPGAPSQRSAGSPPGGGATAASVIALITGLGCLLPGGLCSVLSLTMAFGGREERQIAVMFALIGVPAALAGFFLVRFGVRRLRRGSAGAPAPPAVPPPAP